MRIRVPSAKGDPRALAEIRQTLVSLTGVSEVKVNEALGTVTVHYDAQVHDLIHQHLTGEDSQRKVALESCPKLSDLSHMDEMVEREAEYLARHSHTAEVLLQFVNQLDREIKKATGNALDLKVIAPLALAVGALTGLGVAAATPVWLTLGLFSFNHFIDLHAHRQDKEGESPQRPDDRARRLPDRRS
jgi:hypothetical protein